MKKIMLTQQTFTIVNDEDYKRLAPFKWYNHHGYAVRNIQVGYKKRKSLSMHQVILKPRKGFEIDHINGNELDNRRSNLRRVTHANNMFNQKKRTFRGAPTTSKYRGVSFTQGTWRAMIGYHYKNILVGRFDNEIEAARAYDKAARKLHGKFARLNMPPE
ncbi:MAG: AP2/ERF family transcription factor [Candidatus Eisenbacteria bacterium]|nr:AP2/ERF family transcription factor [Candidatus Eisenbacteria bacterium]